MKKIVGILTAVFLLALAGQASATLVTADFKTVPSGITAGSQGLSLDFEGLRITAKSGVSWIVSDPFDSSGKAANVYWGGLGNLGTGGSTFTGLGVQRTNQSDNAGGPIDPKEGLIFTFPEPVAVEDVALSLLGLAGWDLGFLRIDASSCSTSLGVRLVSAWTPLSSMADFWPAGSMIDALWIQSANGKFGVGSITYDDGQPETPVPIPAALWLLGSGLVGLGIIRRATKGSMEDGRPSLRD